MIPLRKEKIRLLDTIAIDNYAIPSIILMENAALRAADIIYEQLANPLTDQVIILVGKGNNGGDGFAIARHLFNRGISINVKMFTDRNQLLGDSLTNFKMIDKLKIPYEEILNLDKLFESAKQSQVIIDCMLGTGVQGEIKEVYQEVIRLVNQIPAKRIAIDTPTGLNCNTGEILGECFLAELTITFVAAKIGFFLLNGPQMTGKIKVVDIGIPVDLLTDVQQKELEYLESIGINPFEITKNIE